MTTLVIWNERASGGTPFLQAYEQLLRTYATDYTKVGHKNISVTELRLFLGPHTFGRDQLENSQLFDFEGLKGRLLSSSYTPQAGQPNHDALLDALSAIFDTHQVNGQVEMKYDTNVFYGQLR